MRYFATVIVKDYQGHFLTVRHPNKERPWRFLGGKIESGETPEQAAHRELFEEVGLTARKMEFLMCGEVFIDGNHWTGYFFEAYSWDGIPTIKEPEKASKLAWFDRWDLLTAGSDLEYDVIQKMVLGKNYEPVNRLFMPNGEEPGCSLK